jgi:tetratricopeptide (TPR) repeat protein
VKSFLFGFLLLGCLQGFSQTSLTYSSRYQQALQKMKEKKYAEAEKQWTLLLQEGYDSASIFLQRGEARLKQRNMVQASEDLEVYRRRKGDVDKNLLYMLGIIRHEQKEDDAAHYFFGQAKRAGASFQPAEEALWGSLLYQRSMFAEAVSAFNLAEKAGVKTDGLLEERGKSNFQLKQYDAAIKDLLILVRKKPEDPGVNECLGLSYGYTQQLVMATPFLKTARRLQSKNQDVYFFLGNAALEQRQFDEATRYYHQADSLGLAHESLFVNRGIAYWKQRKQKEASADVEKALSFNRMSVPAMKLRAEISQHNEDWKKVVIDVAIVDVLGQASVDDWMRAAEARVKMNSYAEAITNLDKVIAKKPTGGEGYLSRGQVWLLLNQPEKACADFKAAQQYKIASAAGLLLKHCL